MSKSDMALECNESKGMRTPSRVVMFGCWCMDVHKQYSDNGPSEHTQRLLRKLWTRLIAKRWVGDWKSSYA